MNRAEGKIYFASDFHLGIPDRKSSLVREKMLVDWLEICSEDCKELYLMGDVFDFWFEYKTVVPKGYVRLLGKLAQMADSGIRVHLFTGNHDIWAFGYLEQELGILIHREPEITSLGGKRFYLAHGDGLGPGDHGYKFLKKVFRFRPNQWLFRWLHPDLGARMALYLSRKSRLANVLKEEKKEVAMNIQDEMLYKYSVEILKKGIEIDYFVFGHRHLPTFYPLNENSQLMILGDWLTNFSYACFDGQELKLEYYKQP